MIILWVKNTVPQWGDLGTPSHHGCELVTNHTILNEKFENIQLKLIYLTQILFLITPIFIRKKRTKN